MTSLSFDAEHATQDTLWHGQLSFWQPARGRGYRFNLDPVLLSGFVRPGDHALELGAGCGVLGILLLAAGVVQKVTAIEIQPEMAAYARQNAIDNGFAHRMHVVCGDLRTVLDHGLVAGAYDRIVFNPPYFPAQAGPPSPQIGRDIARHERFGTLEDFVMCAVRHGTSVQSQAPSSATRFVTKGESLGAEISAIIRPERVQHLMMVGQRHGAQPQRVRYVHPRKDASPTAALVGLQIGHHDPTPSGTPFQPPWHQEDPLVVHTGTGRDFTDDVRALLRQ